MGRASQSLVLPVRAGICNVFFIRTEMGHVLVDTGMPGRRAAFDKAFETARVDPRDVHLIILTHGHVDHVGNLAHARNRTGAQVVAHRALVEPLAEGTDEPPVANEAWARALGRTIEVLRPLPPFKATGVDVDVVVDEELELSAYGVAGRVIHTPGHTPGSMVIALDDGETIIGDLVRRLRAGRIGVGAWYEDKQTLIESLRRVARLESDMIFLSHGDRIDNETLKEAIAAFE